MAIGFSSLPRKMWIKDSLKRSGLSDPFCEPRGFGYNQQCIRRRNEMKIYNDYGNPSAIFEDYPYMWLNQRYFMYIEMYCTDVDYLGKVIAHGRTTAPSQLLDLDNPCITEEFRIIIDYLEKHPDVCGVLHEVVSIDVERTEGYPLEAIVKFNQISGPVYMSTIPYKGRTTPDILTLEWKSSMEALENCPQ
jgi:hypothetical protein